MARPLELALADHAIVLAGETDFAGWRAAARALTLAGVRPEQVSWRVAPGESPPALPEPPPGTELKVPRSFVERAEAVVCHADPERFAFLHRLLWRLSNEPPLLSIASDPDVRRFEAMEKAVRRDIHKMRAFVRFRQLGEAPLERYVAWFEPEHHIVERNAGFFVRRFTGMRWTILTPRASADWDGERLVIGPGARREDAPPDDGAEALWQTYFASIFNPARLKVKAMQAEMPKKYWRNLPEASLIPELIAGADAKAREMIARMPTSPAPHHAKVQARHWPVPETPAIPDDGAAARHDRRAPRRRPKAAAAARSGAMPRRPCSAKAPTRPGWCSWASSRATRRTSPANHSSGRPARCSIRSSKKPASTARSPTSPMP